MKSSPGGYILDSKPGLYDNVLVLDFKSLYPSIIRTFGIDPYALHAPGEERIEGFQGASFAREGAILPDLVRSIWEERDRAKARGDAAMSQATKILMNSFYGILGATGCRFHDARLASSITRRGHEIIRRTRDVIEEGGETVIYGDTDSLFVLLGAGVDEAAARERGSAIAARLDEWWRRTIEREHRLDSFLEIEFETHFLRFLMPTVRGDVTGSKKRYAGMVRAGDGGHDLVFKGLESVRTDWTPLARSFQRELYRRVFQGEPFEAWVRDTVEAMHAGEHDAGLVYRKRLRQSVNAYTRNVPPHVQAARKLGRNVRWVRYVITASGPEPVEDGRTAAPSRLRPLPRTPARPRRGRTAALPRHELRRDHGPADGDVLKAACALRRSGASRSMDNRVRHTGSLSTPARHAPPARSYSATRVSAGSFHSRDRARIMGRVGGRCRLSTSDARGCDPINAARSLRTSARPRRRGVATVAVFLSQGRIIAHRIRALYRHAYPRHPDQERPIAACASVVVRTNEVRGLACGSWRQRLRQIELSPSDRAGAGRGEASRGA